MGELAGVAGIVGGPDINRPVVFGVCGREPGRIGVLDIGAPSPVATEARIDQDLASAGPPRSRASRASAAVRFPPALSPPITRRVGSIPWSGSAATIHSRAARQSSNAAGKRCSGARR